MTPEEWDALGDDQDDAGETAGHVAYIEVGYGPVYGGWIVAESSAIANYFSRGKDFWEKTMKAFKIYTAAVASFALCAAVPLTPAFAARNACDILAPTTCGNGAWAAIGFYSQEQCVASVEAECNTPGGGGNPVRIIPGPRNDCNSNPVECGMNSHGDY